MEKELSSPVNLTPVEMIMAAVSGQADLDKLKGLMELQFKWEADQARKVFAKAFAQTQANILPIVRNKTNKQTNSKYSDLSDIIEITQPIYNKEGFSVTFNEGDSPLPEHIRIIAEVLHAQGHKEIYHYDVPMDGTGIKGNPNMTKIHAKASSTSYGRRYLMCMIWNIPTADNDGNIQVLEKITDKQLHQIRDLLIAKELTESNLLKYLELEKLEDLATAHFMKALTAINSAKKKD